MKITFVSLVIICMVAVFSACGFALPAEYTHTDYAMNTVVSVTVRAKDAKTLAQKAIDEVKRLDSLMSATSPESDIYKINSALAGECVAVSEETYRLIKLAHTVSQRSHGAFDITVNPISEKWDFNSENPSVPESDDIEKLLESVNYKDVILNDADTTVCLAKDGMSISLGAVAKGYAASQAAKILRDSGVRDAVIDLGGNIYAIGNKRIGIQTPFKQRGEYFTVCEVADTSVVTSGAYERYFEKDGKTYHHIIDPKTGYPAETDIDSVSVICEDSALADALSTAIFVSGSDKARAILSQFEGAKAVILTQDGRVLDL